MNDAIGCLVVNADTQQNASTMYSEPPWNSMSKLTDAIREPGPSAYQTFPAHHFFARVYRPSAVSN
jgi:hypothetical protein